MKKSNLLIIVLITICIGAPSLIKRLEAGIAYNERSFFVEERIILRGLPRDINNLRIWIPYPVVDTWQTIEDFRLSGPFDYRIITDKEYGNMIIYLKPRRQALDESPVEIKLSFRAKRKEYGIENAETTLAQRLDRFLKANRLVPVNGELKRLAQEITQGANTDLARVRAIYDYIIDELTYSRDDPNICGIGNSLLTLQYKKGICTDYHSLFISLVRSLGIPAKFEIGFRIPQEPLEGRLNGYHCWAKFYIKDKGWVPVDISEADKHPEKRDYFFGHIDENRIHLTTGRDISLDQADDSKSLNFFVYPYAELGGLQFNDMDIEISYKDLRGGG
jgi:transglutaminase-like putative cysteine protease